MVFNRKASGERLSRQSNGGESSGEFSISSDAAKRTQQREKEREARETRQKLIRGKGRVVICIIRSIVLSILLFTALTSSFAVYYVTREIEIIEFEETFASHADKILETFHGLVEQKLGSMELTSVQYTQHALATESTFPNVTLPDYAARASTSRILADGLFVWYSPYITEETRSGWEAYASSKQTHLLEQYEVETELRILQDTKYGFQLHDNDTERIKALGEDAPNTDFYKTFIDGIWGSNEDSFLEPPNTGPYFPLWQISPVVPIPGFLNLNIRDFDWVSGAIDQIVATNQASFAVLTNFSSQQAEAEQSIDIFRSFLLYGQYRHDPNVAVYAGDPVTMLCYPVFDNFGPDRKLAGILSTGLYWIQYLDNLLPIWADGVLVVLSNNLGQAATYLISGAEVSFVGTGDLHENGFDYLEYYEDVVESLAQQATIEQRSYTAVDLNGDYVRYSLYVYPTHEYKSVFITSGPAYFAGTIAVVFLTLALLFVIYDCFVQQKQRVILKRAIESAAVVSSLFPSAVRDRLLESTERQKNTITNNNATRAVQRLLNVPVEEEQQGKPIADSFPETTVLFADLAGFTKWSSSREPEHVFELLEALYGAFDSLAIRRKVFKVETIGDCYVAVTGLPKPQPDHAVLMSKFARDCLVKMNQVSAKLAPRLGIDTMDLALRVGLHSGAVTAGVLRGDRSRFQLFGETVAIAARMESGGVKGRIHLSETTADHLIVAGKHIWLEPRRRNSNDDGDGVDEVKTFWLDIQAVKATRNESSSGDTGETDFMAGSFYGSSMGASSTVMNMSALDLGQAKTNESEVNRPTPVEVYLSTRADSITPSCRGDGDGGDNNQNNNNNNNNEGQGKMDAVKTLQNMESSSLSLTYSDKVEADDSDSASHSKSQSRNAPLLSSGNIEDATDSDTVTTTSGTDLLGEKLLEKEPSSMLMDGYDNNNDNKTVDTESDSTDQQVEQVVFDQKDITTTNIQKNVNNLKEKSLKDESSNPNDSLRSDGRDESPLSDDDDDSDDDEIKGTANNQSIEVTLST